MAKLVLVYNANSGKANILLDVAHKLLRPSTYACNLCKLTHSTFTEHRKWRDFKNESLHDLEFLHKDEFKKEYASKFGYKFEFPIVLIENQGNLEVLISSEELNQLPSTQELIKLLKSRIDEEFL